MHKNLNSQWHIFNSTLNIVKGKFDELEKKIKQTKKAYHHYKKYKHFFSHTSRVTRKRMEGKCSLLEAGIPGSNPYCSSASVWLPADPGVSPSSSTPHKTCVSPWAAQGEFEGRTRPFDKRL